jgi:hypothetical protein
VTTAGVEVVRGGEAPRGALIPQPGDLCVTRDGDGTPCDVVFYAGRYAVEDGGEPYDVFYASREPAGPALERAVPAAPDPLREALADIPGVPGSLWSTAAFPLTSAQQIGACAAMLSLTESPGGWRHSRRILGLPGGHAPGRARLLTGAQAAALAWEAAGISSWWRRVTPADIAARITEREQTG